MRILYVINDGQIGGLQRHVLCLMRSLEGVAETAVVLNTEFDKELVPMFENAGCNVFRLRGRSGHDGRIVGRFHRILNEFKPDIIHAHGMPILCGAWLMFHRHAPILHSLHTPPCKPKGKGILEGLVLDRLVKYWLPVSTSTWTEFKRWHPKAKGEVFFNPLRIEEFQTSNLKPQTYIVTSNSQPQPQTFIVGMVGRNADQKDWPSFHKVEELVKMKVEGSGVKVEFLNAGEREVCDGREAIAKMNLFVMTSKHEQLPTTVLECFAIGTPICGFLPVGGTSDILSFSTGPVRESFLLERDCGKLADKVFDLLQSPEKRQALVGDGRQILENHFDAEKNCRGQLMDIYRRFQG